jgi:hypothetical protein
MAYVGPIRSASFRTDVNNVLTRFVTYGAVSLILLFGVLWFSRYFGAAEPPMTLIAALGGALVASFAPVITATLSSLGQERDRAARIRDEASRVAIELTRMDYDLRQRALSDGQTQQVLAAAKVYRELYRAIVELRTEGTWPRAIEELGLLNIFELCGRVTPGG